MPKSNKLDELSNRRWSTRVRRQTVVFTPPGRNVLQLQPSKRTCHPRLTEHRVPSHEEVFSRPETMVKVGKNYCPSPIVVGVIKPKERTPVQQRKERHDVSRFLYGSFGNGFQNEKRYANNPFYAYWNKYGRSDVQPASTFEKNCFLCHELVGPGWEKTESGARSIIAFCGVFNCPKVYHRSCLDAYFKEGDPDSEHWICPRHYCNSCEYLNLLNGQHCPTCPYSTCKSCLNDGLLSRVEYEHKPKGNEIACINCRLTAENLNAPEILMNLRILR